MGTGGKSVPVQDKKLTQTTFPCQAALLPVFIAAGKKKKYWIKTQILLCGTLSLNHIICNKNGARIFNNSDQKKKISQLCQRHGLKLCQGFQAGKSAKEPDKSD